MLLLCVLIALAAAGPSVVPVLSADFPYQYCASDDPAYRNKLICTIR